MAKVLVSVFAVLALLGVAGFAYLQHPKFGPSAAAIRSPAVLASPNYSGGAFHNQVPTPILTGNTSFAEALLRNLTEPKPADIRPPAPIPTVTTDLKSLPREEDLVVWLGHSSFYVHLNGQRILIDPVFSTYAAPVPFANKAFDGANPYSAEDMPDIDVLLITHEHWDHLDYDTITALEAKTSRVVTALGLGAYFDQWGYPAHKVHELDWNTSLDAAPGLTVHALPARHYSRRLFGSNRTLWVAFALVTENRRLFFSGDSGYGPHFAEIGRAFGGFDLVALDSGQYNERWATIHMTPEEALTAATDLGARALMPAHVGKFALARHAWDEPFKRLAAHDADASPAVLMPQIGRVLSLEALPQDSLPWWTGQAS